MDRLERRQLTNGGTKALRKEGGSGGFKGVLKGVLQGGA